MKTNTEKQLELLQQLLLITTPNTKEWNKVYEIHKKVYRKWLKWVIKKHSNYK